MGGRQLDYLIQGKLDNTVHTITYDQLRILYEDNQKEAEESREITEASNRGENYYTTYGNSGYAFDMEYLLR